MLFLENELMYGKSFDVPTSADFTVPIGEANIIREGSDVTICAFSLMVEKSLEAADQLSNNGISAEIIDLTAVSMADKIKSREISSVEVMEAHLVMSPN